jgi:hypothetical protein
MNSTFKWILVGTISTLLATWIYDRIRGRS